jgi:chloramphenicol O-acetyltransferase
MSHFLHVESWPRRAAFESFRGYDNPYFNVCAPLDVTPLQQRIKLRPLRIRQVRWILCSIHAGGLHLLRCTGFSTHS